jgi:hypothetical protein
MSDAAARLRQSFEEVFEAQLIKSLSMVVPEFDPKKILEYGPRISVFSTEGEHLKRVYLDSGWSESSGIFLFSYSDELKVDVKNGHVTATIG